MAERIIGAYAPSALEGALSVAIRFSPLPFRNDSTIDSNRELIMTERVLKVVLLVASNNRKLSKLVYDERRSAKPNSKLLASADSISINYRYNRSLKHSARIRSALKRHTNLGSPIGDLRSRRRALHAIAYLCEQSSYS